MYDVSTVQIIATDSQINHDISFNHNYHKKSVFYFLMAQMTQIVMIFYDLQ